VGFVDSYKADPVERGRFACECARPVFDGGACIHCGHPTRWTIFRDALRLTLLERVAAGRRLEISRAELLEVRAAVRSRDEGIRTQSQNFPL